MNYIIYIFITAIPNIEVHLLPIQDKKICANCKFFISDKKECSKFGDIDKITGKYNYEDALSVRNDESKCGEDAIFFTQNNLKIIYIPFDFLLENSKLIFLLGNACFPFFIVLAFFYIIK